MDAKVINLMEDLMVHKEYQGSPNLFPQRSTKIIFHP